METQRKTSVRLLALALGIAGASEVLAATRYFDCANGNMQTASCWSSNIKPVAGDNAYLGYASFASNVTATLNSGSFAATNEYLGFSGGYGGVINHSAGSNTVSNTLYIGYQSSTNGRTYNLSGTGNLTTTNTFVGYNDSGYFRQYGGTHTVNSNLTIGVNTGSAGLYVLSGGSLIVNGMISKGNGNSFITIEGGVLNVGGGNGSINVEQLTVGSSTGGSHTLSGNGSITTQNLTVGGSTATSTGSFTQTGGTNTATSSLNLGNFGSTGSYTQSGGINNVGSSHIGYLSGGTGTYTQSGGTHTVTYSLQIGYNGTGTYNLQGGTLKAGSINTTNPGATAAFNFTGGTLAVGTFIGNLTNNGGILAPGASPGTTMVQGDYTQGATGTLSIELGGSGAGSFDVLAVGGTATLAGTLDAVFWNGFNATAGDSFDIVSATNLLGGFDTLNLATLGTGLVWNVAYLYDQDVAGTDYLRLSVQAVPEAETYGMMLAGLGLVGWAARRRKISRAI
jgi:hypothetical protein